MVKGRQSAGGWEGGWWYIGGWSKGKGGRNGGEEQGRISCWLLPRPNFRVVLITGWSSSEPHKYSEAALFLLRVSLRNTHRLLPWPPGLLRLILISNLLVFRRRNRRADKPIAFLKFIFDAFQRMSATGES